MIKKYTYGKPFDTEAVVNKIESENDKMPYFHENEEGDFIYKFAENDVVYGLGEQVRGINKRGWQYISWNYDNPHHHEDTRSLYGSHNFMIISGHETFGVFFDYPGRIVFDIGYTDNSVFSVHFNSNNFDCYIITGNSEKDIVRQFRKLVGRSYIPPKWAFGYGQSRWGYMNESDINEVFIKYREEDIPFDSIYLDIDYMDDYKDFTVSKERFPDLQKLTSDMKSEGVHLVPIIDAGVKIEDGYDVYEEGVGNNYFCKTEDGKDFTGAVWPGLTHFPDFLNKDAREWFGKKYERLTKLGIDGFWNDMNEPAIFYTEDELDYAVSEINRISGKKNLGIREFFAVTGIIGGLNGNSKYYDQFYHNVNGKMIKHSDIHNLYGMNMTRSAYEALCEIEPERRTLFYSRSSYIGAHRYGGIWQGDNNAWWSHILMSMSQLVGLNMAGFIYNGSDTGGFGCDTTEDLMQRWLQFSLFTPLFRNHSADGTRYQELYRFGNVSSMKEMIRIRYCLIPYLYSEFLKAVLNYDMMFKPLAFDFPEDEDSVNVEDQLLLGDELMITPVYKQNAKGRYVYAPEEMMLVRMQSWDNFETEIVKKGHHYIKFGMQELVFFIRQGKAIPFGKPAKNTAELTEDISMIGYNNSSYMMYNDDGISSDINKSLVVKELKN